MDDGYTKGSGAYQATSLWPLQGLPDYCIHGNISSCVILPWLGYFQSLVEYKKKVYSMTPHIHFFKDWCIQ